MRWLTLFSDRKCGFLVWKASVEEQHRSAAYFSREACKRGRPGLAASSRRSLSWHYFASELPLVAPAKDRLKARPSAWALAGSAEASSETDLR